MIVYATHERKHPYAARLPRYVATLPLLLFVVGLLSTFQAPAAAHHRHFSAEDIVVGMIYLNLGRKDLGLRSLFLFYGIDARIAAEALCSAASMTDDPWCAH